MPKPKKGPRLGSGPAHQKLILSGLASSLLRDGRVKTTEARAKAVRPVAERMITHAKKGDLAARREVLRTIRDRDIVHHLFANVGPAFAARNGGYTRITKIGPRKGDAAPMAIIELVEQIEASDDSPVAEETKSRRRLGRRKAEPKAAKAAKADEHDHDHDHDDEDEE